MKAFRNLAAGEDQELAKAYEKFHKLVEREKDVARKLILKKVQQISSDTSTLRADILDGRATTQRIEQSIMELAGRADQAQELLEGESHTIHGKSKSELAKRPRDQGRT